MNRVFFVVLIALMMISGMAANAGIYTFTPSNPSDLSDLPHEYFYTWGIQWTLPANEVITGAEFTYKGIYDWTYESGDHLYTHLLNSVSDPNGGASPNYLNVTKPGYSYKTITIRGTDNQGGGDNFAPQNIPAGNLLLGNWSDPYGDYAHRKPALSYSVPTAQLAWLNDGNFGFGIDPDCHYYNCGVEFKITTERPVTKPPIPEPMSIMLGIIGLGSVAGLKRFRR